MLNSFYLFITPLIIIFIYIFVKLILHFSEIKKVEKVTEEVELEFANNLEVAKEKVFTFFDKFQENAIRFLVFFSHAVLHFFVIFLKFVSDITDVLYARSRDFFLQTAAKEKKTVSTFWHHLKEYKKEKESELEEEKK